MDEDTIGKDDFEGMCEVNLEDLED